MQGRRLRRVFHIASMLMESRYGLTLDQIHARLGLHEASPRTVRRDLDDLRNAGLLQPPQRSSDLVRHAWRHGRSDPAPRVTEKEFLALLIARAVMASFRGTALGAPLDRLLAKLQARLGPATARSSALVAQKFLVRPTSLKSYEKQLSTIRKLLQAVLDERPLAVSYHASHASEPRNAAYDPLGLLVHDGNLYAVVRDRAGGEIVKLKVDRILRCRLLRGRFARPPGFQIDSVIGRSVGIMSTEEPATRYTFRAFGYAARNVREDAWHETQQVSHVHETYIDFSVEVADETELLRRFFSLLPNVRVLGPPSFRGRVHEILAEALRSG